MLNGSSSGSVAYAEGLRAYNRGIQRQFNPYIGQGEGDTLERAWFRGWDSAKDAHRRWVHHYNLLNGRAY